MRLSFKDSDGSPKKLPPKAELLTAKCGHSFPFSVTPGERFADERRTKALIRDCPPCRKARAEQEAAGALARKASRDAKRAVQFVSGYAAKGRLPDGAKFEATFDAVACRWHGSLIVGASEFRSDASAVQKLLCKLDVLYREALKAKAAPP